MLIREFEGTAQATGGWWGNQSGRCTCTWCGQEAVAVGNCAALREDHRICLHASGPRSLDRERHLCPGNDGRAVLEGAPERIAGIAAPMHNPAAAAKAEREGDVDGMSGHST